MTQNQYDKKVNESIGGINMEHDNVKIGCDPEFLIEINDDKVDADKFFSVHTLSKLGCDGYSKVAELRPDASFDVDEVVNDIRDLLKESCSDIISKDPFYSESINLIISDPEFSLGGHIHFSHANDKITDRHIRKMKKMLDLFIGIPTRNMIDANYLLNRRDSGYGKLGEFRSQFHGGWEYRTPTAAWMHTSNTARIFLGMTQIIVDYVTLHDKKLPYKWLLHNDNNYKIYNSRDYNNYINYCELNTIRGYRSDGSYTDGDSELIVYSDQGLKNLQSYALLLRNEYKNEKHHVKLIEDYIDMMDHNMVKHSWVENIELIDWSIDISDYMNHIDSYIFFNKRDYKIKDIGDALNESNVLSLSDNYEKMWIYGSVHDDIIQNQNENQNSKPFIVWDDDEIRNKARRMTARSGIHVTESKLYNIAYREKRLNDLTNGRGILYIGLSRKYRESNSTCQIVKDIKSLIIELNKFYEGE